MAIRIDASGTMPVLAIEGELSIYTAAGLKPQLSNLLLQHRELELDLYAVNEIDSAGLQLLIATKREATVSGRVLRLTNHSPAVLEAFDLCNMAAFFGDPLIISEHRNG